MLKWVELIRSNLDNIMVVANQTVAKFKECFGRLMIPVIQAVSSVHKMFHKHEKLGQKQKLQLCIAKFLYELNSEVSISAFVYHWGKCCLLGKLILEVVLCNIRDSPVNVRVIQALQLHKLL